MQEKLDVWSAGILDTFQLLDYLWSAFVTEDCLHVVLSLFSCMGSNVSEPNFPEVFPSFVH